MASKSPFEMKEIHVEASDKHATFAESNCDGEDRLDATKSNSHDRFDMDRMGKAQVMVRQFRSMSTFSFVAMACSVWEFGLFSVNQGLYDGGRSGLIWMTIIHAIMFVPIILSMAEMASIAPTAGGQFHWTSEFAPPRLQRWLSYLTGWISAMAWQAGYAIGVFLTGTLIQVVILVVNPNYAFPAWHGSLIVMGNICFTVIGNMYLTRYIPRVQTLFFSLHVMAFFAVIVPILVNAPKASAREVFLDFTNLGGWSSTGYATLAGQLSAIYMMCGADSAVHISEEVRSAQKTVPITMISSYACNMVITIACFLTVCFALPDVRAGLADPSEYPAVYILRQSMSTPWVVVELVMIICLVLFANVCYLTAVSREVWAFARDGGLPFSKWCSQIHPKFQAPVNAMYLSGVCAFMLSLIYIGSTVAFYAITSLWTVAMLQCYLFSIGSILWRRIKCPETIPPSYFSLGKWGIPINATAFVWCLWAFIWSFWPQFAKLTPNNFNWAIVIFAGVIFVAVVHFAIRGHRNYHGPVTLVRKHLN